MINKLKLIVENDFYDYDVILEQENPNSPKFFKIRGPYIVSEEENANGRSYRRVVMEKAVLEFDNEMIQTGRAMGELNHPEHTDIDQERVCHRIIKMVQENNTWIGESIVLSSSPDGSIKGTPSGDILAAILQHGGKPGMSTRGVGNITEGGVVDEYKLITVDSVSNPSGPGCFIDGILESKNFMVNTHGDIIESAFEKLEKKLATLPNVTTTKEGDRYLVNVLKEFICSI